jgi:hypothetical protein
MGGAGGGMEGCAGIENNREGVLSNLQRFIDTFK